MFLDTKPVRKKYAKPTKDQLREAFDYRELTGQLVWVEPRGSVGRNSPAGTLNGRYHMIRFNGALYNARDLIWIWHYGDLPEGGLKHVNGQRFDNRIENITPRVQKVSFM